MLETVSSGFLDPQRGYFRLLVKPVTHPPHMMSLVKIGSSSSSNSFGFHKDALEKRTLLYNTLSPVFLFSIFKFISGTKFRIPMGMWLFFLLTRLIQLPQTKSGLEMYLRKDALEF